MSPRLGSAAELRCTAQPSPAVHVVVSDRALEGKSAPGNANQSAVGCGWHFAGLPVSACAPVSVFIGWSVRLSSRRHSLLYLNASVAPVSISVAVRALAHAFLPVCLIPVARLSDSLRLNPPPQSGALQRAKPHMGHIHPWSL